MSHFNTWALIIIYSSSSYALRNQDLTGDDNGAVAVYSFNEAGGSIAYDQTASPLNLTMSTAGNLPTSDGTTLRTNAFLQNGYLLINPKPNGFETGMNDQGYRSAQVHRTFLSSNQSASKINSCLSNGFTIQLFMRPWFPFHGNAAGGLIVGLSNSLNNNLAQVPNLGIYQTGNTGSETITLRIRNSQGQAVSFDSLPNAFYSVREGDNIGKITEVIATYGPNTPPTIYVNRVPKSSAVAFTASYKPDSQLVIGNELVALEQGSIGNDGVVQPKISEQRNWSGEIYHLAIYCNETAATEILGSAQPNTQKASVVVAEVGTTITNTKSLARKFVERLTGIPVPIDHLMVAQVENYLKRDDRLGAAKVVTGDKLANLPGHPEFLNTQVKILATRMSNREETMRAPLNDFSAAFIGITRDERNAKELLTEDFFYMAHPNRARVRADLAKDILLSNNHYEDLDSGLWDIGRSLVRVPGPDAPSNAPTGQMIVTGIDGSTVQNPDPAGVLSSRAFMQAHAVAGTNRRPVEYSFRSFLCVPMADMADTSASTGRIGRDVDRFPAGDAQKFETNCKGCHSVMDGYRGAFARFDFANLTFRGVTYQFIRNTEVSGTGAFGFTSTGAGRNIDSNNVVYKMNHNFSVFPNGHQTIDDSFVNNAVGSANRVTFGWRGQNSRGGVSLRQYGNMIAESTRFSQCMAKRVYESVCIPGNNLNLFTIKPVILQFAEKFEQSGYNLRRLYQEVAASPVCLGEK